MARSNYSFHKRQKELARKQKRDEKRERKLKKNALNTDGGLDGLLAELGGDERLDNT